MQALRLARPVTRQVRCLTTTANPSHVGTAPTSSPSPTRVTKASSIIPLGNVEAQWEKMSVEDKVTVHEQLEEVMKKDWKELSVDEKKAAYYVSFGPHGPRAPSSKPGDGYKIFASVAGLVGVTAALMAVIRSFGSETPKTLSKEWQEATNEKALEARMNPLHGISSEGYSGKGFVSEAK
ncbi:Cytochrome c oxidase subunit 5B, mitochondrial [Marasmius crinis-equi]|uniref:Cytochrome c oxidase subunit 5B, mitochondrial n=1 Tax=Marasmius crinis-equi TaxID=585013 RepID=A0ABR3FKT9_9AGAR